MLMALLLAAATAWPDELEGVRLLPDGATPACEAVKPGKIFEGRAPSRDEAFRALALKVKTKGADTVQLERVYIRDPGGIRVARGRAYKCGPGAAGRVEP